MFTVVLETAMGKYRGKLTAEVSLFREIDNRLEIDDIFLADRAYAGWFEMAHLMQRGVHVVVRKHQHRKSAFRTGIRYGKDDHSIQLDRPERPEWSLPEEHASYPEFIIVREVKIRVEIAGFCTKEIIVHTSLYDDIEYSKDDIAALFRRRWQAELNLRSVKTIMQMEHLRCKEPHRVRDELRAHMIAYNLIRQVMVEPALEGGIRPWQISFKGTMSTVVEMLPILRLVSNTAELCDILMAVCGNALWGIAPTLFPPDPKRFYLLSVLRRLIRSVGALMNMVASSATRDVSP